MEELSSIIPAIIIIAISIASSAAKSKKKKQQQNPYPPVSNPVQPQPAAPVVRRAAAPIPAAKPVTAQPIVHPHLVPDCETHDAPTMGSLGVVSTEGKDPCHEDQLSKTRTMMPPIPEAQPALVLDWSGESMVKAFVMQEVLTRPCDRRR